MIGRVIAHYEIREKLGAGAMGDVYRARDRKLERDVAVKILRGDAVSDRGRLARFEQEARAASSLNHPNIVTVYDVGQHDELGYIVMEYVEGETLREILSRGPIPSELLVRYATQIAEGLSKAHQAGIVHRDLKPENIIINRDGYAKIVDFGLAKLRPDPGIEGGPDSEVATLPRHQTAPGTILGTVGYMSPEQATGAPVDFRSDQFAFGAILYEMATGNRAFQRGSAVQTLNAIIENEPPPIASATAKVPAGVVSAAERCLRKKPAERYASTSELATAIATASDGARPEPTPSGRLAVAAILVLGLLAALAVFWMIRAVSDAGAPRIESIAVLPLDNLSGDPEQDYFADGMTEALIADLAKIEALKVISRTSVMQYKGVAKPSLPEIARELGGVDAVIEGSVLNVGNSVRITVQLIEADSDEHLWAESYERELEDVLTLQSEIARTVADEVRITLTPEERELLSRERPVNPEAHEAYLKGRFYWDQRSPESVATSTRFFQQAISIDPDYALAYVGLADAQALLMWFLIGAVPPVEGIERAEEYVTKALELDDTLGEAYVVRARLAQYRGNSELAERSLERAHELAPNHAPVYQSRGMHLSRLGRHNEAALAFRRARELDPLSLILPASAGLARYWARDYEGALALQQQALAIDPDFYPARILSVWVHVQREEWEAAHALIEEGRVALDNPAYLAKLGHVYAGLGRLSEARETLEELIRMSHDRYVDGYHLATVYLALGDHENAVNALEAAFDQRSASVSYLEVDPAMDPLRSEPRFQDLLRRAR